MSDAKHTPGPWKVGERNAERHAIRILSPGGSLTAEARGAGGPWPDVKANANLIAAAPALADALEAFVAVHTEDGICGPQSSAKAEGAEEWCGWCVAARAALRAAGRLS